MIRFACALIIATGVSKFDQNCNAAVLSSKLPSNQVYTIEVLEMGREARSVLGSGFLVEKGGKIVTNYHVVSDYIGKPEERKIRIRTEEGIFHCDLIQFDVISDLALLQAPGIKNEPLVLSEKRLKKGAFIKAIGNPHNLGISEIDGIYNGRAAYSLIDRMVLSAPLNPGMSGGPILDSQGNVVGVNVSIIRGANSIAFGIPSTRIVSLLKKNPLHAKTTKHQFEALVEQQVKEESARLRNKFQADVREGSLLEATAFAKGNFLIPSLPPWLDCTGNSKSSDGFSQESTDCSLQFSPYIENVGDILDLELSFSHSSHSNDKLGFMVYGHASQIQQSWIAEEPYTSDAYDGPHCISQKIKLEHAYPWLAYICIWKLKTFENLFSVRSIFHSQTFNNEVFSASLSLSGASAEDLSSTLQTFIDLLKVQDRKR